jgi:hypothetical protein
MIKSFCVLGVVISVSTISCGGIIPNSNVPAEIVADYNCIQTEWSQGVKDVAVIEAACLPGQLQTVIDIITTFLSSPSWVKANPTLVAIAQQNLDAAKAQFAAGAR